MAAGDPTSRQTGQAWGLYEREVRFYTDIAPRLTAGGTGPVAPCHHAAIDPGTGIFDLHLDDGTHLHGVDLRIPGFPPLGVGYVQSGAALTELEAVVAREVFGNNNLPVSTEIGLQPGGLVVDAQVLGHAPVRLVASDGRVSHFPRAWATVTTRDGRRGVGRLERNRNQ